MTNASMELEVTIMRSSLPDYNICTGVCPSESFRLLNDSKLRCVCTGIIVYSQSQLYIIDSDALMPCKALCYNYCPLNKAICFIVHES